MARTAPPPGIRLLDHTADVGFEVDADSLAQLIGRAALGMDWLLREAEAPAGAEERRLDVASSDPPSLLRATLRELLLWHERDGFSPAALEAVEVSPDRFRARVRGGVPAGPPIREIKGITLHRLAAEPRNDGWFGRVIFDV